MLQMNPDVGRSGLRFVCLCPGFTNTSMLSTGQESEGISGNKLAEEIVTSAGVNT